MSRVYCNLFSGINNKESLTYSLRRGGLKSNTKHTVQEFIHNKVSNRLAGWYSHRSAIQLFVEVTVERKETTLDIMDATPVNNYYYYNSMIIEMFLFYIQSIQPVLAFYIRFVQNLPINRWPNHLIVIFLKIHASF